MMTRQGGGGGNAKMMNFGKSRAKLMTNDQNHVTFNDVAGLDEEKEELIAVKIYEPSIFQNSSPEIMKKRFLREGKKLLSYSHPNVVKAFDYGFLGDESAYIKMEYPILYFQTNLLTRL